MKKIALFTAVLATTVLAQTATKRIIEIQGSYTTPGGNAKSGPYQYTGNPVKAKVSTLNIEASKVLMQAPKGVPMLQAQGKRTAEFTGDIKVTRGRLSATGEKLDYSEATGQGVLTGNPSATFVPKNDKDGPVKIKANQMSLDVDNNVSTSTGNVVLTNEEQTGKAEKLIFDEDKELAQLTGNPTLTRAAKSNRKELVMSGDEVRALTKSKTLYVKGGVKIVQGKTVTTGDAVYYNDEKDVAYVVGNAKTTDGKTTKVAPASGHIVQRTDRGSVQVLNGKFDIPTEQFKLRGEK